MKTGFEGRLHRPASLVEVARTRAGREGGRTLYTFLADGEREAGQLTFAALDRRARAIATAVAEVVAPGERVLLLYPPGLDFIAAFFSCLYSGAVAVPAYPPRPNRGHDRLRALLADADPRLVLTCAAMQRELAAVAAKVPELGRIETLATDAVPDDLAGSWTMPPLSGETLALVQYTSGSTSAPKGVRITHANLLHNAEQIRLAFRQSPSSVVISWLPLYHDMGLIGGVLQPLYAGGCCFLMSPLAFLQRPARWLEAISRYRATTSGGPNFAYELCARRHQEGETQTLDLGSWQVAFNGAEPVRAATLDRFAATFAPHGFRRAAFLPCYGLAEATLFVAGEASGLGPTVQSFAAATLELGQAVPLAPVAPVAPLAAPAASQAASSPGASPESRRLVSCGQPGPGQQIAIVDPATSERRGPGRVGEIWVAGPSVAAGYHRRSTETAAIFGARIAGESGEPHLRTGDLGFLAAGRLFVTGRMKDLIIIRGRNHYPQDVEATVERSHPELPAGGSCAVAIERDGEERLAVICELPRRSRAAGDLAAVAEAVRREVAAEHEIQLDEVAFIRAGALPRTSSGKVRRQACRAALLDGTFEIVAHSRLGEMAAPAGGAGGAGGAGDLDHLGDLGERLRSILAPLLRVAPAELRADRPLASLGIDSLAAVELRSRLAAELGVEIGLAELLETASLGGLTALIASAPAAPAGPRVAGAPAAPAAPAAAPPGPRDHPATPGQRSLWLLEQMAPESGHQNVVFAARVRAAVDAGDLVRGVQTLVDRHAALRTTFAAPAGELLQRVHARLAVTCERIDASGWSAAELGAAAVAFAHRPFALEREPPLRLALLSRSAGEHVLVAAAHHIAIDFRSFELLRDELEQLYPAGCARPPEALPPPAAQAFDFARWQERLLAGPEGERQWAYWRNQLAGELPVLALPCDRPHRAGRSHRGGSLVIKLDAGSTGRLRELARQQGTTLFVVLLAAFELLLHRYSGERELLIGSPASGRTAPWLLGVVGYLMNPLVLRSTLAGDPPFRAFLAATRAVALGALEHQDFPAHLLAERLRPGREGGHGGLFQAMLAWNRPHRPETASAARFALGELGARMSLGGLTLESFALPERRASFDLQLTMVEAEGGVAGSLLFATDLFDRATAARLAAHFRRLLAAVAEEPETAARGLPLLTAAESHQLAREWNERACPAPSPACVHWRISAQAAATPDATAVAAAGGARGAGVHLTYGELERRSNQLARRLRAAGIGPEARAALLLERAPELIVAMLAVLKAGGAYVPIDPAYPPPRVSWLLADSAARLLLTTSDLLARAPAALPPAICLDTDWPAVAALPADPPADLALPAHPAYAIYTSGSLGRPKGVLVSHAALAAYTEVAAAAYDVTSDDHVLQFASISFDTCGEEVYPCLARGATLVLRSEAMLASIADFLAACGEQQITILDLPTAFWHEWVAELAGELAAAAEPLPPALRLVILGGERVRPELLAPWCARAGGRVRLVNSYGPTEATIVATMTPLAGPEDGDREVSIGRPIPGASACVLDRHLLPVPIGVAGELYLGGSGLARGYLGQPGLTAERFLPDPRGQAPGERLYRTGDLVKLRPDGQLAFVGRVDHQLKVRGYRVEPGEIEAILRGHPDLREAVVIAREEAPSRPLLTAYVVPGSGRVAPGAAELALFAGERLPAYMVPAAFVALAALPFTPSGKLDRLALPAPARDLAPGAGWAPPRTVTEELVAGACAEVLGLERIGRHDDLFALGCHSLLAMRIVARLRAMVQVELPLVNLFETPTVAQLAARLMALGASGSAAPGRQLPPLAPAPRDGPLPLSFAQERIWFLTQLNPGLRAYHVPRALRMRGELDPALVARTFGEIVRRHEILRTTFPTVDGVPVQVIHLPAPVPLPLVDLAALAAAGREPCLRRLLLDLGRQPFDLARGPLLRLRLVRLAGREHVLSMTEHHLVHDGWTQGVLLRDFVALYRAFLAGVPAPLPALAVQYADFACWQRQWLRDEVLDGQLRYWQERLAGAPATLDLPADRPRPRVQSFAGMQLTWVLPAPLCRALRAANRSLGATLFMTMLAAFDALLLRYTGQDDLVVGTGVANRRVVEVEGLLGMLINTLALRVDAAGDPRFAQLVERVRAVCIGAYANQDLPFEKLVAALRGDRTLSHTPLFQVFFAFMDTPMPDLALPGLELEVLDAHNRSAKFDLNLTVLLPSEQGVGLRLGGRPDEITLLFELSTDLFEPATAVRMLGHFQTLLAGAAGAPERRLSELPLLAAAERHQLLVELAGEGRAAPAGSCLHQLFEAQAERAPGAVAVSWEGGGWTYGELEARANRLAWRLRSAGAGPERLVGLCLESPPAQVLGILATLKAGAAYLPLDPHQPRVRWELLLADAAVALLVTEPHLEERFAVWTGSGLPRLLPVALDEPAPEPASARRPITGVTPENLAYVIYTSGSTGAPKGVLITHANVARLLAATAAVYGFGPEDVWTLFHSYAFDFSVWELWGALAYGGRLVLVPRWQRRSPAAFYELLSRQGVTVLNQTPSAFGALLRAAGEAGESLGAAPPGLRWVIFGGEALEVEALRPWMERLGVERPALVNMYGITETTVHVTWRRLALLDLAPRRGSPIGAAIADLRVVILDFSGNPVPLGVPGELYVAGAGLARGYLGRPALTAERFVPDPFGSGETPGGRLYRTGDLGRFVASGEIEYLGRCDHQVKVRGYRIELGEIEALLAAQPQVAEVAVVVRGEQPGDRRLVAYAGVGGAGGAAAGGSAAELAARLRQALQEQLPDYMVPAQLVVLERLPRTATGKVDRQALPAPSGERPELRSYVPPRNPVEEVLAGMIAELLEIERVGAGDDFFDLGGHSLLATQLTAWVRDALKVELPLRALFADATVAGLAATLLEDAARRPAIEQAARLLLEMTAMSDEEVERELRELQAGPA
ncbi:MAG TPA: amino acid adenylation domain-containing protein [Thermoanaerobaculia bacterium]